MTESLAEVVVVGAGVSGLSCAAALAASGVDVVVLDRRRLGGRAVTWRLEDGGRADYGVTFYHGERPDFRAALRAVDGTVLEGWPHRILGQGTPCQPHAFAPRSWRLAFAEGVAAFPRHLARNLDLRCQTTVATLRAEGGRVRIQTESGDSFASATVVLALAGAQAARLLGGLANDTEVSAPAHLLALAGSQPCLTLVAAYGGVEGLPWDLWLPDESRLLQLVSNESAKRAAPGQVLVLQARPGWSRDHLSEAPELWSRLLLDEAALLLGAWARSPTFVRPHVWRYARTDRGSELSGPLLVPLGGGARLGLVGELFCPGAGVEAAWASGQALAARLLAKE